MKQNKALGQFVTLQHPQPTKPKAEIKSTRLSRKFYRQPAAATTFDNSRKHFGWFWDGVASQILWLIILLILIEIGHLLEG